MYAGPTSVLAGREDGIVGYADQFHAIDRYPDVTYVALSAAGHYLPFEQPAAFRSLTQEWLARCSSRSAEH